MFTGMNSVVDDEKIPSQRIKEGEVLNEKEPTEDRERPGAAARPVLSSGHQTDRVEGLKKGFYPG